MTREVFIGLVAISAMFWLPALLAWSDRRATRPRPERPEHVTPTQVRLPGQILRPGRQMDRWQR